MKKKLVSEFVGTFFLFFLGCGTLLVNNQGNKIGYVGVALSFGFALAVLYFLFKRISGAHFNPAISFTYFMLAEISFLEFLLYSLVQFVGGVFAAILLLILFPLNFSGLVLSVNNVITANSDLNAKALIIIVELVFSFILSFVYLSLNIKNGARSINRNSSIFLGFIYFIISLFLLNIDGFGINPVRIVIPAILNWKWFNIPYYLTANFIGALVGGITFHFLYKKSIST